MKLSAILVLLLRSFNVCELQVIEEILEQYYAFKSLVAHLEYRADAFHLPVHEDNILFVVDDVSNFLTNIPNLSSKFVYYLIQ